MKILNIKIAATIFENTNEKIKVNKKWRKKMGINLIFNFCQKTPFKEMNLINNFKCYSEM